MGGLIDVKPLPPARVRELDAALAAALTAAAPEIDRALTAALAAGADFCDTYVLLDPGAPPALVTFDVAYARVAWSWPRPAILALPRRGCVHVLVFWADGAGHSSGQHRYAGPRGDVVRAHERRRDAEIRRYADKCTDPAFADAMRRELLEVVPGGRDG